MRLKQDAIDLLEVDGAGAVSDGFEQGSEAEIACSTQDPLGDGHDQGPRDHGFHQWITCY